MSALPYTTGNRVVVGEWALVNLTPHPITVHLAEGGATTVAGTRSPARIAYETTCTFSSAPWPMVTERQLSVLGVPGQAANTLLVVSRPVATELHDRDDLVVPTRLVRDAIGQVVSARALARVLPPR
ncbi:hypothetical protein ACWFMI_23365 [Nocardiopsis terrae]|uniref:hypothetical protein n=1 Tax=Streptomyces sp. NPDC057554 TaxID=3350538 RepID=UPI0036C42528